MTFISLRLPFFAPAVLLALALGPGPAHTQTPPVANPKAEAWVLEQVFSLRAADLLEAFPRTALSAKLVASLDTPSTLSPGVQRAPLKYAPEFVDAQRSHVSESRQPGQPASASVDLLLSTRPACVRMDAITSSPACPGARVYELKSFFRPADASPVYIGMICPPAGARDVEVRLSEATNSKGCVSNVYVSANEPSARAP